MKKMPLKKLLVALGLCEDEKSAASKILAKEVKVDDVFITTPNVAVFKDSTIEVKEEARFVSRGGLKLEHAILKFNIPVTNSSCLDIGSSTGGFSDCLLQYGAAKVTCVDVNYGQLAWQIRNNPKTRVFERTNIKCTTCDELGGPFDIVVIDVSFIGLASLSKKIREFCYSDGRKSYLVALIKPQFESRKEEVLGGVVKDAAAKMRSIEVVKDALFSQGFEIIGIEKSPILGKKMKNEEFLLYACIH